MFSLSFTYLDTAPFGVLNESIESIVELLTPITQRQLCLSQNWHVGVILHLPLVGLVGLGWVGLVCYAEFAKIASGSTVSWLLYSTTENGSEFSKSK